MIAIMETLFDMPLSRRDDPVTSYRAAERVDYQNQKERVYAALKALGPSTSAEVAQYLGTDRYMPARRLPDLVRAGRVAKGPYRRCKALGTECIVYEVQE